MENLISLIEVSISGNNEESAQAMNEICEMEPTEELFEAMFSIGIDPERPEIFQKATFVYIISKLRQFPDAIKFISLEKIAEALCSTPFSVQIQVQRILYYFVDQQFKENNIPELIEFAKSLISEDENALLVLATIIRRMMKPKGIFNIIMGIGDREDLHEAIYPFFDPLIEKISSSESHLFIHTVLKSMNSFLKFSFPEDGEKWMETVCSIIQMDTSDEIIHLDKDSIKIAVSFIELHYSKLPGEVIFALLEVIASHPISETSYSALPYIVRYIYRVAQREELWETLAPSVSSILSGIFFPIISLTEDHKAMFETDVQQFLSLTHELDDDCEFSSPISSVFLALQSMGAMYEDISQIAAEIVKEALPKELESNSTHNIYSLAQLIGSVLRNSPIKLDLAAEMISIFGDCFNTDDFTKAAFFLLIYYINLPDEAKDESIVNICIQNVTETSHIVRYFAILDASYLLNGVKREEIKIEDPCTIIKTAIDLSKVFHDNYIVNALSSLIDFFSDDLVQNSEFFMSNILDLIKENPVEILEVQTIVDVILKLFSIIKELPCLQEVCEAYLVALADISNSLMSKERILYLFADIFILIPSVPESLAFIPDFLVAVYEDNQYLLPIVSKTFAMLSQKIHENSIAEKIFGILQSSISLIEKFYKHYFLLVQTLFITLSDLPIVNEMVQPFLEILFNVDTRFLGDIYATLGLINPIAVFSDDIAFRVVLDFSTCLPYLKVAHIILNNILSISEYVVSNQEEITARIGECLEELPRHESDCFYDVEEIASYYN